MRAFYTTFFTLILALFHLAQTKQDSLKARISSATTDSLKIIAYTDLVNSRLGEPKEALRLLNEMHDYGKTIKNIRYKGLCLRKIGALYSFMAYYDKALEFTYEAADLFEKSGDTYGLAYCYNNIGNYYNSKGEFTNDYRFQKRSIEYHLKSVSLRDTLRDTIPLMGSYNNLGNSYAALKQFEKALTYYNKAYAMIQIKGETGDDVMINQNLGNCYVNIAEKDNSATKQAYYKQALFYFLNITKKYNPKEPTAQFASIFSQVGYIYDKIGQNSVGMSYLEKALEIANSIHDRSSLMDAAYKLSGVYERKGEFKKAVEFMHIYNTNKDSLINEKNSSKTEEMQVLYKTSQKDREIEQLGNERKLKDAELTRSRTIIISSIGAAVLVLILVFVLWSGNNAKRRANLELAKAYRNIENKNKQITDSINYSKRIQTAILPPHELVLKNLSNFFVYYSPRDIVSGDFYWFSENNNKLIIIVVDCTGHGVPGALMSMIGNTLLNEIVNQKDIVEPGEILNYLNKGVKHALRQSGADSVSQDDGMDVSVCCIDKEKASTLKYACANHSIFVKSKGKVIELTGDIFSIGGDFAKTEKTFETKTHKLEPDSFVVMSTDGYYDQFGGEKDTKFLISNFENLIQRSDLEQSNVATVFEKTIGNWKGSKKQTDDILVTGFKI